MSFIRIDERVQQIAALPHRESRQITVARTPLGDDDEFDLCWELGGAMTLEAAARFARDDSASCVRS